MTKKNLDYPPRMLNCKALNLKDLRFDDITNLTLYIQELMKKTLFAMLALATMMPAMADNWVVFTETSFALYDEHNQPADYTLYLYVDDASSITSVMEKIGGMTLAEFTGEEAVQSRSFSPFLSQRGDLTTEAFPTTISTGTNVNNIWGVCVYSGDDGDAAFAVGNSTVLYGGRMVLNGQSATYAPFKSSSPATPEPATATLSLLALAGLATRRKRK